MRELVKKAESHEHFPLTALEAINAVRRHLGKMEFAAMSTARDKGASWADIGKALGVSRQAVQVRFTKLRTAHHSRPGPDMETNEAD